jgi:hypothetical protein
MNGGVNDLTDASLVEGSLNSVQAAIDDPIADSNHLPFVLLFDQLGIL